MGLAWGSSSGSLLGCVFASVLGFFAGFDGGLLASPSLEPDSALRFADVFGLAVVSAFDAFDFVVEVFFVSPALRSSKLACFLVELLVVGMLRDCREGDDKSSTVSLGKLASSVVATVYEAQVVPAVRGVFELDIYVIC